VLITCAAALPHLVTLIFRLLALRKRRPGAEALVTLIESALLIFVTTLIVCPRESMKFLTVHLMAKINFNLAIRIFSTITVDNLDRFVSRNINAMICSILLLTVFSVFELRLGRREDWKEKR
jgi:hypothetical protein